MADDTPPTGINVETPPAGIAESNPIKELREQYDFQKNTLKAERESKVALEARIKELELAALGDTDRMRKELEDLKPLRDENGRYKSVVQSLYDAELAAVPEDVRAKLESLSATGEPDVRLQTLRTMKELLPPKTTVTPQGTVTNPAAIVTSINARPEISHKNALGDYFAKYSPVNTQNVSNVAKNIV